MKSKLSPQGRKLVLLGGKHCIRVSVQFRRGTPDRARTELVDLLGAKLLSTGAESGVATIEIRADQLTELAESPAVDYVDVGGRMAPFFSDRDLTS